jgi:predicted ATPase
VTSWLHGAAAEHGLLLVLDDLHWSTRPTLQLLHARPAPARRRARCAGVVVGTYRDTDVDRTHPLVGRWRTCGACPGR